jgi:hypothetical protein
MKGEIMAMWLYQLSEDEWSRNKYRLDIWEGERWEWGVGRVSASGSKPEPGDTVAFFYAPTGCDEPGFYGWAVILLWVSDEKSSFYFRPVAPSDRLKMHPWWDAKARKLADQIRGNVKRGTLWPVSPDLANDLATAINSWVGGIQPDD